MGQRDSDEPEVRGLLVRKCPREHHRTHGAGLGGKASVTGAKRVQSLQKGATVLGALAWCQALWEMHR